MDTGFRRYHVGHAIVFETDDGVGRFVQTAKGITSLSSTTFSFEGKRHSRECDHERAHLTRDLGDNRCCSGPSASAETGTDKDQPGLRQSLADFIGCFLRGIESKVGIATGAESASNGPSQLHFHGCHRTGEGLRVGVGGDEIGLVHPIEHNAIQRI